MKTQSGKGQTPPAQEILPATYEQTTEIPVLALHDVPVPIVQDEPQSPVVARASRPERTESPEVAPAPIEEASARSAWERGNSAWERHESVPVPETPPQVAVMQTKLVGRESSGLASRGMVSPEDSAHATSHIDSQPQADPSQTASTQPTVLFPIAAGPVSTVSGNTQAPGPNAAQTNPSPAVQLSSAFVAQARVVNYDGRTDFHLRLQPPQLGSVQIHLTATDHTISARIVVTQDGTRQLIEGQVQQLQQSLAEAGLVLGSFNVTHNGGGFSQGGHHQPTEPPPPPLPRPVAPTPRTVVKTYSAVPTGGINILA